MMDETTPRPPQPTTTTKPPIARREPRPPWMAAILADWCTRWPAAFTKPVPLAVGFSGQMKAALRAEGKVVDRKTFGLTIHSWTMQGSYLHAVMRGEMRRNLDGSEAGVPDEQARQQAKKLLDERATRRAERARPEQERKQALAAKAVGSDA
jgi:sRNA-binding protein